MAARTAVAVSCTYYNTPSDRHVRSQAVCVNLSTSDRCTTASPGRVKATLPRYLYIYIQSSFVLSHSSLLFSSHSYIPFLMNQQQYYVCPLRCAPSLLRSKLTSHSHHLAKATPNRATPLPKATSRATPNSSSPSSSSNSHSRAATMDAVQDGMFPLPTRLPSS